MLGFPINIHAASWSWAIHSQYFGTNHQFSGLVGGSEPFELNEMKLGSLLFWEQACKPMDESHYVIGLPSLLGPRLLAAQPTSNLGS